MGRSDRVRPTWEPTPRIQLTFGSFPFIFPRIHLDLWVFRGELLGPLPEAFVGAGWEWAALASDLSHLAQSFPLT